MAAAAGFCTASPGELETGELGSSAGAGSGRCGRLGGAGAGAGNAGDAAAAEGGSGDAEV